MFIYVCVYVCLFSLSFFLNVIVVQVQLSSFFPHYSPLPPLPDLPPSILPPLALYMGPLYMFLNNPSPSFPIISISHLLWLLSGEGGGTAMCGCLSCVPYWGPGPQPRHMLWLGITGDLLVCRPVLRPLSHTSQRYIFKSFKSCIAA